MIMMISRCGMLKNDSSLNDLIAEIKNGDYGNFDILLEKYRPLIASAVAKYAYAIDPDDVRQISFIALFNAVRSYDLSSGVTFGLYSKICVNNALITELRKNGRIAQIDDADVIDASETVAGPEEEIIRKEDFNNTFSQIRDVLTKYEYDVFRLYLMGYSYKSIADKLSKDEVSVGNALARIKNKIKNHRFV